MIVIIGAPASGKSTAGRWLSQHCGYEHIESSECMAVAATKAGIPADLPGPQRGDRLFTTHGWDAVERIEVAERSLATDRPVAYSGCRTVEGLATMKRLAVGQGWSFEVLRVEAPLEVRFERARRRGRSTDGDDLPSFAERCQRDLAYGALQYAELVSDYAIDSTEPAWLSRLSEFAEAVKSPVRISVQPRASRALLGEVLKTDPCLTKGRGLSSRGEALAFLADVRPEGTVTS